MNPLCTLDDAAAQINAEHALALKHADQAIEHARRVGQMLLAVKQSLAHGEFQTWLDANVTVSARQARRYMAAAQGKPLPIRKMASPLKTDTVSVLSAATVVDPAPKSDTVSFLEKIEDTAFAILEWADEEKPLVYVWIEADQTRAGIYHFLLSSREADCYSIKRGFSGVFIREMINQELPPHLYGHTGADSLDWKFHINEPGDETLYHILHEIAEVSVHEIAEVSA